MDRDALLETVEEYLRVSGMKPTRFGKLALKDPLFVTELRRGRDLRTATVNRVLAWMRDNPARKVA